jgi:hypothetical protein
VCVCVCVCVCVRIFVCIRSIEHVAYTRQSLGSNNRFEMQEAERKGKLGGTLFGSSSCVTSSVDVVAGSCSDFSFNQKGGAIQYAAMMACKTINVGWVYMGWKLRVPRLIQQHTIVKQINYNNINRVHLKTKHFL